MERLYAISGLSPRCKLPSVDRNNFFHELLGLSLACSINQLLVILLKVLSLRATLTNLRSLVGNLIDEGVMKHAHGTLAASEAVRESNDVLKAICEHIEEFLSMIVVSADILDCDDKSTHKVASKLIKGVELLSAFLIVNLLVV